MTFKERLAAAHQELASKGVWQSHYAPLLFRLLRRLGYPVKPPHYQSWLANLLGFGISAGLIWGLLMWLFSWHGTEMEPVDALRQTALFAALFGLLMASSIGIRRIQLKLTPWEQLAPTTTTPTIHE